MDEDVASEGDSLGEMMKGAMKVANVAQMCCSILEARVAKEEG